MKVGILAGGLGSRISEETVLKPKPMVEIGNLPILWHIMRYFAHFGHKHFVVALGYKGDVIKRFAADVAALSGSIRIDYGARRVIHDAVGQVDDWIVDLVETGQHTMTGGRIKRMREELGPGRFLLTYGDGLANVDLNALLAFHAGHGKLATLTAVRPPARFGHLEVAEDGRLSVFTDAPQAAEGWINGGFFVLEPQVVDYIDGDDMPFERDPLRRLAEDGQLMAFRHHGFWQCMDTLRDKVYLERVWQEGSAPWQVDGAPARPIGIGFRGTS